MSQLHKIFKELSALDYEDFDLICDAWRIQYNVKRNCTDMGIRYSEKFLINSLQKKNNHLGVATVPTAGIQPGQNARDKKLEKIILGDNLDIIEEAAKKRGLM